MKRALACLLVAACIDEPLDEGTELATTEQALNGDTWAYADLRRPPTDETKGLFDAAFSPNGRLYVVGSTNSRWVFKTSTDGGVTYSNGPSFYYPDGALAIAREVAVDSSGRILVVGEATDAAGDKHVLARLSTDQGATFTTVDEIAGSSASSRSVSSLTVDANGQFTYVINKSFGGAAPSVIRRSKPGALIWGTVAPPSSTKVLGLCNTNLGLIAIGQSETSPITGVTDRFVGGSWTRIDSFRSTNAEESSGRACVGTAAGLYVAGIRSGAWVVRRGTNNGTTWTTVDTVASSDPELLDVNEIGLGRNGRVYVVGTNNDAWVVRRTTNGVTWADSDVILHDEPGHAEAHGYAFNPLTGDTTVVGQGDHSTHVRRLLPY